MAKGFFNVAEQSSSTKEGKRHGPDPPKDLIPSFDADTPLVERSGRKKSFEAGISLGGQTNRHVYFICHPTKEHLACRP